MVAIAPALGSGLWALGSERRCGTEGREGFVHPYVLQAGVDRTAVRLILRDFDTAGLRRHEAMLRELAEGVAREFPGASVEVAVEEQYRNMREVIDQHPQVVNLAREAISRAGLEVHEKPLRDDRE